MPQQNYLDELTPAFTSLLAIKEASRCLLCHDAPCSQACPAQTDPGKFIRSIYFRNFKGAAETIRENNALGAVCARVCPTEKLCKAVVPVPVLMLPLISAAYSVLLLILNNKPEWKFISPVLNAR